MLEDRKLITQVVIASMAITSDLSEWIIKTIDLYFYHTMADNIFNW